MMLQLRVPCVNNVEAEGEPGQVADAYLTKPVEGDELLAVVRALLRLHDRSRDLEQRNARLSVLAHAAEQLLTHQNAEVGMLRLFSLLRPHFDLDSYWDYDVTESGEGLVLASADGLAPGVEPAFRWLGVGQALCGTCAAERRPLVVPHVQSSLDPKAELVKRNGTHAYLCFPLVSEDVLLGTLAYGSHRRDTFAQDEVDFLGTIAQYATAVKARRRAAARLGKRNERLELLTRAAETLLTTADPSDTIRGLFDSVRRHLRLDAYLLHGVSDDQLRLEAHAGLPDELIRRCQSFRREEGPCGASLADSRPVLIEQLQSSADPDAAGLRDAGFRCFACHPLMVGDRCLGTLSVASLSIDRFEQDDLDFLRTVCHYVAMAKERTRLLAEVTRREEMLMRSQRGAQAGSWEIDLRHGRIYWSDAYCELFGFDRGVSPSVETWLARVHPDDRERVRAAFDRIIEQRTNQTIEYRIILPDGGIRWIQRKGQFVLDGDGRPIRISGVSLDITDRKQAEEELKRSHAFVRQIVDIDPNFIFAKDRDGRFTLVNQAVADCYGTTVDALIGKTDADFNPNLEEVAHFRRKDLEVLETQTDRFIAEERITDAQGRIRWLQTVKRPILDEQGRAVQVLGVATDITARKQFDERITRLNHELGIRAQQLQEAVDRLRVSESRIKLVTDSLPVLVAYIDANQRFRFNNKTYETWFGYSRQEITGRTLGELLGDDAYEQVRPHVEAVLNGEEQRFEISLPYKHVGLRYVEVMYMPDRAETGEVVGFFVMVHDLTDRRQAEDALRKAEDALRRLNAELEQRVTQRTQQLIQSQTRLRSLASELTLTEQRERRRLAVDLHDYLAQLLVLARLKLGQAKRIGHDHLIEPFVREADEALDQALTYTRTLVAELAPPVLQEFGLPAALRWLADRMEQHELMVSVHCEDELLRLPEEQAILLFQSVRELLINVAKHADCAEARVDLTVEGPSVRLVVHDKGQGFDVVAAGSRSDSGTEKSQFGLFSIKERMAALGGHFTVASTPGSGTTAVLTLPLTDAAERQDAQDSSSAGGRAALITEVFSTLAPESHGGKLASNVQSPIRVLLADDHAMVRQGLRTLLDGYGDVSVIGEAADGDEVIQLARSLQPDVVVMDVNMPGTDGIEATRILKGEQPTITVIGLSVHTNRDIEQSMRTAGAAEFLTKEAAVDRLHEAVRNYATGQL
jgi:PAS domain S-box-containing protein